jgi:drug/metabolite transporter (DMT)-like permease
MYWIALVQIVSGLVIYQASQKSVGKDINPFIFVAVSYGLGMLLCIGLAIVLRVMNKSDQGAMSSGAAFYFTDSRTIFYASGLALGATLIELGYFMGYRHGWGVTELPLAVTIATSVCLTLIGTIFFREPVPIQKIIGIGLSLCGIALVLR